MSSGYGRAGHFPLSSEAASEASRTEERVPSPLIPLGNAQGTVNSVELTGEYSIPQRGLLLLLVLEMNIHWLPGAEASFSHLSNQAEQQTRCSQSQGGPGGGGPERPTGAAGETSGIELALSVSV